MPSPYARAPIPSRPLAAHAQLSSLKQKYYDAVSDLSPDSEMLDTPSISDNDDESDASEPITQNRFSRKLAQSGADDLDASDLDGEDELTTGQGVALTSQTSNRLSIAIGTTNLSTLEYARSRYAGFVPPLPITREHNAVHDLRKAMAKEEGPAKSDHDDGDGEDFTEFELNEFAAYLPKTHAINSYELRGLQDFASKTGYSSMMFDGILSFGCERRYVQEVPFELCSIGNYGIEHHTVGEDIWIQSVHNEKGASRDVYYKLKNPSPEYLRFHQDFLWLADLAKHFVDYSEACEEKGEKVSIHNFRRDFSQWACKIHRGSSGFQSWWSKYCDHDFRRSIVCNIRFLFKESVGVKDSLRAQPIWAEVMDKHSIKFQPLEQNMTVVTPYVYDCFSHMIFGKHLKAVTPTNTAHNFQQGQGKALNLTLDVPPTPTQPGIIAVEIPVDRTFQRELRIKNIKPGDVLKVPLDDSQKSQWKNETSAWKVADDCWYVYVQEVHESSRGNRSFDAIWLYKPSDTSCARMKYPFPNELFLSNNCACGPDRIKEDAVVEVVDVEWYGRPSETSQRLFVRQTYLDNDHFVTLKEEHKRCEHLQLENSASKDLKSKYPLGQTVLVPPNAVEPHRKSKFDLEPFEIISYESTDSKLYAIIRRLRRRHEVGTQEICSPNELVYTVEFSRVEARKIERTCLVRFYNSADVENKTIPAPYNRKGTGNTFFITSRLSQDKLVPVTCREAPSLIQGFDPSEVSSRKKLRGLDLYCGGGNFGRGLEEGGALHNEWAVDMDKTAIHTYSANLHQPTDTNLFFGSVNDQLYQAIKGNPKKSKLIPLPGQVGFISAGSPCQGYSALNNFKNNDQGTRNQSLVASVAAYIDFYRPEYGLLENVLTMAQKGKGRDQDVLSQLICAIVGMGYQLSIFMLDAWSCGSAQSRSRIFVSFTAPGCQPLTHPALSHAHPQAIKERGLGRLANGQAFGERRRDLTPFDFTSVGKAAGDLPNIGDGRTYSHIKHPEHVLPMNMNKQRKLQIAAIPTYPRGMNFAKAWAGGAGVMTEAQRAMFPSTVTTNGKKRLSVAEGSHAWARVDPDHLFQTVVKSTHMGDGIMGRIIHWDQHRVLTVMESRRAQSFPDHEVILGPTADQMMIIGNSVDRTVSLALGLSLREAWLKNDHLTDLAANVTEVAIARAPTRDHREKLLEKARNNLSLPTKAAPTVIPHSLVEQEEEGIAHKARDSSQSMDDGLGVELDIPRRTPLVLQSTPSSQRIQLAIPSANGQTPILKRPLAAGPKSARSDQARKATKISAASSPSKAPTSDTNVFFRTSGKRASAKSPSQPVNVVHLGKELQEVLLRNGVKNAGKITIEIAGSEGEEDSESSASSSRDEDVPAVRLCSSPLRVRTSVARAPHTTQQRVSPTYIDLTQTDDEAESAPKLPVRPAATTKPTSGSGKEKYTAVGNEQFAAYAQTHAANNFGQMRKHGPQEEYHK